MEFTEMSEIQFSKLNSVSLLDDDEDSDEEMADTYLYRRASETKEEAPKPFELLLRLGQTTTLTKEEELEQTREQLRRHVWVAPYYEDDLERLKQRIGADHILFETDYPHTDTTWPNSKEYCEKMLEGVGTDEQKYKILRGNAIRMLELDRD